MMRTITHAAILAFAADPVMWDGVIQNSSKTPACGSAAGFNPSDTARSVYRPHIAAADPQSAFSLVIGTTSYLIITNKHATKQFNGSGQNTIKGVDEFLVSPAQPTSTTYQFTQTPVAIQASTDFVTLAGHIDGYGGIAGCNLTFQATYVRRP